VNKGEKSFRARKKAMVKRKLPGNAMKALFLPFFDDLMHGWLQVVLLLSNFPT
jgi:hypothetical protein